MKPTLLLLVQIEREAQAGGIDPTLAELAQPPYSLLLRQGVCDLRQARRVGDMSKTVAFFGKLDTRLLRRASHIFVTIEDNLGGERRMSADLDGDMAPVRIEDMKPVVIDVGHRLLPLEVVFFADIPYRSLCPSHQHQEQSPSHLRLSEMLLRQIVLAFTGWAVDDRKCREPWRKRGHSG